MVAKAFVNDPIASTLHSASVVFARRAVEISEGIDWTCETDCTIDQQIVNRRAMEQTIGAVIVAVASMEGMINEILAGSTDRLIRRDGMANVSEVSYKRWARLWEQGFFERGQNALEKCQMALDVADLPLLPKDRGPVQDVAILISLRNELVHSEPKYRPHGLGLPQTERDSLERRLAGRFQPNALVPTSAPFIWQRCLGAGCAKWSVETESAFQNALFAALGISIRSEIKWDFS